MGKGNENWLCKSMPLPTFNLIFSTTNSFFGKYLIFIFHGGWLICVKWRDNWERRERERDGKKWAETLRVVHSYVLSIPGTLLACLTGPCHTFSPFVKPTDHTNSFILFFKICLLTGRFPSKDKSQYLPFFLDKKKCFKLKADPVRLAGGWPRRAMRMPFLTVENNIFTWVYFSISLSGWENTTHFLIFWFRP